MMLDVVAILWRTSKVVGPPQLSCLVDMIDLFASLLLKIVGVVSLICAVAYIYLKKRYRYWKSLGVPGPEPMMILGNMKDPYTLTCTEPEMTDNWYKKYRSEPFIGFYNLWKPTLLAIDPEFIKNITEVDFNHFTDHPAISGNVESDSIIDSLFTMKGDRWKLKRQMFSRIFAPRKLKDYSELMNHYNAALLKDIDEHSDLSGEIEICQVAEKHMIRTIGSIMYSLDLSQDPERASKLLELSEIFAKPDPSTVIKVLLYTIAPDIFGSLGLKTFPRILWEYFSNFTDELLYSRREGKFGHDDIVDLISKMQMEGIHQNKKINFNESVGHIFSFFLAGLHTTLTTLCYILYELGQNIDVQDKLRNEIDNILNGDKDISYESVNRMNYLNDVINETLRLYPLVGVVKRNCTKEYRVNDKFTIPKGTDILIPIQSLHLDPEYFPDPQIFRPERFSSLDKPPFVFMPFGKGPRYCIGTRLAYISLKVSVAKIISEYLIFPSPKTNHPIKYDPKTVIITVRPRDGIWLNMKRRQRNDLLLQ